MKRRSALTVVVALTSALSLLPSPASAAVSTNAEWITESLALNGALDGAIARDIQPWMNGYPTYINSYWSNWAAIGLIRTGDPADLQAAWNWLSWYQAHMNDAGHVRNQVVTWAFSSNPPTFTLDRDPMDEYFSTVGNAGTFLIALRDAYVASGNNGAKLAGYRTGIQKAVDAIAATMDTDGLAERNPRFPEKLVMDQAEGYTGLRRAALLLKALGDNRGAQAAGAMADDLHDGVASMWNASNQLYHKAKDENGALVSTTWNRYYQDSTAQAWVVAVGQIPPQKPLISNQSRARLLMDNFAARWPEWSDPYFTVPAGDPRETGTSDGAINYWPWLGHAFEEVGLGNVGLAGVNAIDQVAISEDRAPLGRQWPFTSGHAGQIIYVRGY